MAGSPFRPGPFRGDVANDAVYPLPDALYRRLVKARAIMVLGDGTIYTFSRGGSGRLTKARRFRTNAT